MNLTSCGTLVILITSIGEIVLYYYHFFFHFTVKKKKQITTGLFLCRLVCHVLLQGVSSSGLEIVNKS